MEHFEEEKIEDIEELTPLYDQQGINPPQNRSYDRYDVPQTALTQIEIIILHTSDIKLTSGSEVILLLTWCNYLI